MFALASFMVVRALASFMVVRALASELFDTHIRSSCPRNFKAVTWCFLYITRSQLRFSLDNLNGYGHFSPMSVAASATGCSLVAAGFLAYQAAEGGALRFDSLY